MISRIRIDRKKIAKKMLTSGAVSSKELAKLANLSSCTVSSALGGKSCSFNTVSKLAKALRCNPEDIATIELD